MSPEQLIDALDAALFTGDFLYDPESRIAFEETLTRWQRRCAEVANTENEIK